MVRASGALDLLHFGKSIAGISRRQLAEESRHVMAAAGTRAFFFCQLHPLWVCQHSVERVRGEMSKRQSPNKSPQPTRSSVT